MRFLRIGRLFWIVSFSTCVKVLERESAFGKGKIILLPVLTIHDS